MSGRKFRSFEAFEATSAIPACASAWLSFKPVETLLKIRVGTCLRFFFKKKKKCFFHNTVAVLFLFVFFPRLPFF